MRKARTLLTLTLCATLAACETPRTINGVEVDPAQEQSTFCGRNLAVCLIGGAAVVGGIALAASGGYSKKTYSATGGTTGTTMGGTGYP